MDEEEWTPTTNVVREAWADFRWDGYGDTPYSAHLAEFDRWLSKVKAEAFEEGRNAAVEAVVDSEASRMTLRAVIPQPDNPHDTVIMLCLVSSYSEYSFISGKWVCSLPDGHDGPHVAYKNHDVTGNGVDVAWLGPWEDGRAWEGEQADRLMADREERP